MLRVYLLLFTLVFVQPAQSQSTAPFLYYYSTEQGAFIIERADGSEQRILAEYRLPDSCFNYDGCNVAGPGFSASMNWFAWTSNNSAAYPSIETDARVVNVNTGRQYILLNGAGGIFQLSWSPINDMLLIEQFSFETGNQIYYIWDTDTTWELFTYPEKTIVEWTPDEQLIAYLPMNNSDASQMFIMNTSGEVVLERHMSRIWDQYLFYACKPAWSNLGSLMYINSLGQLTVMRLTDNQEFSIDFQDEYLIRIEWSPDEKYALIFSSNECAYPTLSTVTNLWLMSYDDREITLLSNLVIPPLELTSLHIRHNSWSTNGDNLSYITSQNGEGIIRIITLPSLSTMNIPIETLRNANVRPEQTRWLQNGHIAYYGQSLSGEQAIHSFDPVLATTTILVSGDIVRGNFAFSPGDDMIVFDNLRACNGMCIFNIVQSTHTALEFLQDARSAGSRTIDDFIWHPSEHFLFVTGSRIGGSIEINVVNADTLDQRAINGWFILSPASFGWFLTNDQ